MTTPYHQDEKTTLYQGDALAILQTLPNASVGALITDPPYSSGGAMRSDRAKSSAIKYTEKHYGEFSGDNRDQRGYACITCTVLAIHHTYQRIRHPQERP